MLPTLALAALASAVAVRAQDLSALNNVTSLQGTWSTGNGVDTYISTGRDFCNPAAFRFNAPQNTGLSYSFTDDGFWEEAQYQFDGNPKDPNCIAAKLIWQHGTYAMEGDSLILTPWSVDGRIQVQNRCAPTTTQIFYYQNTITFKDWGIDIDPTTAQYTLRLNRFDGAKLPPMYLAANPPNMLPPQPLTGTNSSGQINTRKRSTLQKLQERYSGAGSVRVSTLLVGAGSTAAAMAVLAVTSVF